MFNWLKSLFSKSELKEETRTVSQGEVICYELSGIHLDKYVAGFIKNQIAIGKMKDYKTCLKFIQTREEPFDLVPIWRTPSEWKATEDLKKFAKKYKILSCKSGNPEFDSFIKELVD